MGLDRLKYLAGLVFLASISIFLRFSLFGFDSWASWLCVKGNCDILGWQPTWIFSIMPDSLLFFKLIMFVSLFLSVVILWKLVKDLFDERSAWLSIIFLFASTPFMLFEFGKFENELFAFPLILLGLYFLFLKKWYFFVPLLTSLYFWMWPGYFLPKFAVGLLELQLFAGLFNIFFGLIFVVVFFFTKSRWNIFLGFVFCGFLLWSSHLTIFILPVIVIGMGEALKLYESRGYNANSLIVPAVILILCFNVAFFLASPTISELEIVQVTANLHNDTNLPVFNDWSYGHWLRIYGVDTIYRSGGLDPDYNFIKKDFVALTNQDLSSLGCESIMGFASNVRSVNLWKCIKK